MVEPGKRIDFYMEKVGESWRKLEKEKVKKKVSGLRVFQFIPLMKSGICFI
jgi:hypothetical protein